MTENFIPCAFVNGNPVKYAGVRGYKVERKVDEGGVELVLNIIRDVLYEHPETKEITLTVPEPQLICRAREHDRNYSMLALLWHAQENVSRIVTAAE